MHLNLLIDKVISMLETEEVAVSSSVVINKFNGKYCARVLNSVEYDHSESAKDIVKKAIKIANRILINELQARRSDTNKWSDYW